MIQPILIGIALLASALGFFRPVEPMIWDAIPQTFGATNFPTSLDSLTNPSATDSVATVSHSAQHANANDAIEALQAKLGIGASTATVNTIFVGTGTGSSAFSTFATTTSLVTTNLLVNGSSTLQNFTASNSTTTNATTTNLYVSGTASTTNLNANTSTFGNSTIESLTVSSCSGCSSSTGISTYTATSSTNRYMAKTLNLVAGDTVIWWGGMNSGNNCGTMAYRISSPWSMASTTLFSDGSCSEDVRTVGPGVFLATTTSTVTFDWQAGNAVNSSMVLMIQNTGFNNNF